MLHPISWSCTTPVVQAVPLYLQMHLCTRQTTILLLFCNFLLFPSYLPVPPYIIPTTPIMHFHNISHIKTRDQHYPTLKILHYLHLHIFPFSLAGQTGVLGLTWFPQPSWTWISTMFVQDIETFSVLHTCWLTILFHPFNFLTTQCTFFSSLWISTFFTIDVLCSLLEAIWYSGFRNITILKLLSH